jgi:hypothetical protein
MFTRNFSGEPPLSTFLLDARVRDDKRKDRDSSVLNEWDTSKIRPLFKAYDRGTEIYWYMLNSLIVNLYRIEGLYRQE